MNSNKKIKIGDLLLVHTIGKNKKIVILDKIEEIDNMYLYIVTLYPKKNTSEYWVLPEQIIKTFREI